MKKKKNSKGVVLIFVLVFTVAICTLVIFFHGKTAQYTDIFAGTQQIFLLENVAQTGIELGKSIIKTDRKTSDIIIEESPAFQQKEYQFGDFHLSLLISDENAKVNPNSIFTGEERKVNPLLMEVFNKLFIVLGYPETLPAAILDWIDEDDLQRTAGAESFYYKTAGLLYMPPNRNLYSVEEILLIKDFNEDVVLGDSENEVKGLINFMTSFSDGKINVNTCEPEVLGALGFPAESREKIITERQQHPLEERFMTNINKEVFLKNRSIIVFKSNYFLVDATAVNADGMKKQVRAYVKRKGKELSTVRMEVR